MKSKQMMFMKKYFILLILVALPLHTFCNEFYVSNSYYINREIEELVSANYEIVKITPVTKENTSVVEYIIEFRKYMDVHK